MPATKVCLLRRVNKWKELGTLPGIWQTHGGSCHGGNTVCNRDGTTEHGTLLVRTLGSSPGLTTDFRGDLRNATSPLWACFSHFKNKWFGLGHSFSTLALWHLRLHNSLFWEASVHHRMLSCTLGLYSLDASSIPSPKLWCLQILPHNPLPRRTRAKSP